MPNLVRMVADLPIVTYSLVRVQVAAAPLRGVRADLDRYRRVLGVPSLLVVMAFLLSETVVEVIFDVLPKTWGKFAWLGVLLVGTLVLVHRWTRTFDAAVRSGVGAPVNCKLTNRRGVVLVVGLDSGDVEGAAAKLLGRSRSLEYLALVGTPQTAENGVSGTIQTRLLAAAGHDLPASRIKVSEWGNAESIADGEQAVSEAIEWMVRRGGLHPSEVVVDITAGRRATTYGALTAATTHKVEAQYLASAWDTRTNTPLKGLESFKVVSELWDDGIEEVPHLLPAEGPRQGT